MLHRADAFGRCNPGESSVEMNGEKWCLSGPKTLLEFVDGKLSISVDAQANDEFVDFLKKSGIEVNKKAVD